MNKIFHKSATGIALVITAPVSTAHSVVENGSISLFHYLTSSDHVAVLGLTVLAVLVLTLRDRSAARARKRD